MKVFIVVLLLHLLAHCVYDVPLFSTASLFICLSLPLALRGRRTSDERVSLVVLTAFSTYMDPYIGDF